MRRRNPAQPKGDKTYILEMTNGGQKRITVPASWKVTFGPLVIGSKNDFGRSAGWAPALRFYEGKEYQRAIFMDVKAFRDASLVVEEKVVEVQRRGRTEQTPDGERDVVVEARATSWRNADTERPMDTKLLKAGDFD